MAFSVQAMEQSKVSSLANENLVTILGNINNQTLSAKLNGLSKLRRVCRTWNRLLKDKNLLAIFLDDLRVQGFSEKQRKSIILFLVQALFDKKNIGRKGYDEGMLLSGLHKYLGKNDFDKFLEIDGPGLLLDVCFSGSLEGVICLIDLGVHNPADDLMYAATYKRHVRVMQELLTRGIITSNYLEAALKLALEEGMELEAQLLLRHMFIKKSS